MTPEQSAPIILAGVSYVAGFLSGFLVKAVFRMKTEDNAAFVLIVVTIVWAISMLIDIISPQYETSPLVHGLMGAIVGFFYRPWRGGKNGEN